MSFTQIEAQERADELVAMLNKHYGKSWTPEVWENLGWHYAARLEGVRVWPSIWWKQQGCRFVPDLTGYYAAISKPGEIGSFWASERALTPVEAIDVSLQVVGEDVGRKTSIWLAARDALGIQEGRLHSRKMEATTT